MLVVVVVCKSAARPWRERFFVGRSSGSAQKKPEREQLSKRKTKKRIKTKTQRIWFVFRWWVKYVVWDNAKCFMMYLVPPLAVLAPFIALKYNAFSSGSGVEE